MASGQQLSPVDGLAQLSFVVQGMLEHRAAEHGLSIIQARLLGVLRDRTPTMNELARLLGLDKSSVTGLVDRAERRGLVMRVPSTTDRRAVLVSLTDDGRALVSQAAACFEADVLTMLERLPSRDREALSGLVSRLLAAHAAEQGIDLFPAAAQLSWGVQPRFSRRTPHDKRHACEGRVSARSIELVAELAAGVDGQFPEHLLEVVLDGVRGNEQAVRDLLVRVRRRRPSRRSGDSRAVSAGFRGWGAAVVTPAAWSSVWVRSANGMAPIAVKRLSASSRWSLASNGCWWRRSHSPTVQPGQADG